MRANDFSNRKEKQACKADVIENCFYVISMATTIIISSKINCFSARSVNPNILIYRPPPLSLLIEYGYANTLD